MNTVSLAAIERRVVRYCKRCKKPCKENHQTIRLLFNEYMSSRTAQIDFFCTKSTLTDLIIFPKTKIGAPCPRCDGEMFDEHGHLRCRDCDYEETKKTKSRRKKR